jgi:PhnB protein
MSSPKSAVESPMRYLATRNTQDVIHSGAALFNPWQDDPSAFPIIDNRRENHVAHLSELQRKLRRGASVLCGKVTFMMRMGESPMGDKVSADMKDKIMHATLQTPDGSVLMGADHPQGKKVSPAGFCVSLQVKEMAEAERIFKTLSDGGQVQCDFQKTFWSPGFGMCIDRFEVPWMVNCEQAS